MTQPSAALDQILARTRYLLLDFDGPICDFYPDQSGRAVADQLRAYLQDQGVTVPDDIATSNSPIEVLTYSAAIDPDLADKTEAKLTALEWTAAASAVPNAYVADLMVACRKSVRMVAIVSNISAPAIRRYLERHDLDRHVALVIGRYSHDPDLLKPSPFLVERAISVMNADPATCTMLGDSPTDIESARQAGITSIGYANKPRKYEQLAQAGADAVVTNIADLVLCLRAHGSPSL
jgi:phosphoglycolate phosphatase-like HAD superfamily hydrolase